VQTIRRYANRKLYHVEGHRYVKLDDVAALIRAGDQVHALEYPAEEDITVEVLAQVVARERSAGLASSLAALIRRGRLPLEEAGWHLGDGLGLPSREQWVQLERQVARLESLLDRFLDQGGSRVL
jgi:hypothetical protein